MYIFSEMKSHDFTAQHYYYQYCSVFKAQLVLSSFFKSLFLWDWLVPKNAWSAFEKSSFKFTKLFQRSGGYIY